MEDDVVAVPKVSVSNLVKKLESERLKKALLTQKALSLSNFDEQERVLVNDPVSHSHAATQGNMDPKPYIPVDHRSIETVIATERGSGVFKPPEEEATEQQHCEKSLLASAISMKAAALRSRGSTLPKSRNSRAPVSSIITDKQSVISSSHSLANNTSITNLAKQAADPNPIVQTQQENVSTEKPLFQKVNGKWVETTAARAFLESSQMSIEVPEEVLEAQRISEGGKKPDQSEASAVKESATTSVAPAQSQPSNVIATATNKTSNTAKPLSPPNSPDSAVGSSISPSSGREVETPISLFTPSPTTASTQPTTIMTLMNDMQAPPSLAKSSNKPIFSPLSIASSTPESASPRIISPEQQTAPTLVINTSTTTSQEQLSHSAAPLSSSSAKVKQLENLMDMLAISFEGDDSTSGRPSQVSVSPPSAPATPSGAQSTEKKTATETPPSGQEEGTPTRGKKKDRRRGVAWDVSEDSLTSSTESVSVDVMSPKKEAGGLPGSPPSKSVESVAKSSEALGRSSDIINEPAVLTRSDSNRQSGEPSAGGYVMIRRGTKQDAGYVGREPALEKEGVIAGVSLKFMLSQGNLYAITVKDKSVYSGFPIEIERILCVDCNERQATIAFIKNSKNEQVLCDVEIEFPSKSIASQWAATLFNVASKGNPRAVTDKQVILLADIQDKKNILDIIQKQMIPLLTVCQKPFDIIPTEFTPAKIEQTLNQIDFQKVNSIACVTTKKTSTDIDECLVRLARRVFANDESKFRLIKPQTDPVDVSVSIVKEPLQYSQLCLFNVVLKVEKSFGKGLKSKLKLRK